MKIAIAGSGNVAQYLTEEFTTSGHHVVMLTRNPRPGRKAVEQRQTDYGISSLIQVLEDCDALISTVADYGNPSAAMQVHLTMLQACEQSKRCKTFIPSEWTSNVEDYPEQPMFFAKQNKMLHEALEQAKTVRWTIVCNSWFIDYVVPQAQRHLRDVGELWPMHHANKVFTIYGPGTQLIDVVSVRDVAKAVAVLLESDKAWEPHTYLSGEQLTWNELFDRVKKSDAQWKTQNKPLADTVKQITDNASPESVIVAQFEILSYSGASAFPKDRVQRQRSKYFSGCHFRTVEEILDAAASRPSDII